MSVEWQGDCGDVVAALQTDLLPLAAAWTYSDPYVAMLDRDRRARLQGSFPQHFIVGMADDVTVPRELKSMGFREMSRMLDGEYDPASYTATATGSA